MKDTTKISAVFNVKTSLVVHTENWMDEVFELISYRIIPDTQKYYEDSAVFRKLVKQRKAIQEEIDKWVNEHG